jgi:hypothetical protein
MKKAFNLEARLQYGAIPTAGYHFLYSSNTLFSQQLEMLFLNKVQQ